MNFMEQLRLLAWCGSLPAHERHRQVAKLPATTESCYDTGPSYRRVGEYCAGRSARIVVEGHDQRHEHAATSRRRDWRAKRRYEPEYHDQRAE